MGNQPHIIGRTVLELDSGNLADVWELQETMGQLLQQRAMADLETLFDALAGSDEVIRFDQVIVDLGAISAHDLEDEFVPTLVKAMQEALGDRLIQAQLQRDSEHTPVRQPRTGADWEVLIYFLQYGRLPWWQTETHWPTWLTRWQAVIAQSSSWQQPLLQILSDDAVAQRLAQFPPTFCHQLIRQLHPSGITALALMAQAHQLAAALGLSTSVQAILETVATQLTFDELKAISSPTTPFPALRWMQRWLASLQQLKSAPVPPSVWMRRWQKLRSLTSGAALTDVTHRQLRAELKNIPVAERTLWQRAIEQAFVTESSTAVARDSRPTATPSLDGDDPLPNESNGPLVSPETGEAGNLEATASTETSEPETIAPATSEPRTHKPETGETGTIAPETYESDTRESDSLASETSAPEVPETVANRQVAQETEASGNPLDLIFPNTSATRQAGPRLSPEEAASGIYIRQAGLVLLHPFLAAYLRKMGLVDDEAFGDDVAQQTAIYLLHYLATGQRSAPEYELVLPKLLCGWCLEDAIAPNIPLTEEALTEADNLLQTVINYWDALKNTSPDGLREGFLQRDGKLIRIDGQGWKLQVEQMAIDVLMTRLPWGVSMVKLPWKDELLTVEWT